MSDSTGRKVDPGFRRNLLIIGGTLLAAVLVAVLVVVTRKPAPSATNQAGGAVIGVQPGGGSQTEGSLTPQMQQMLREQQIAEAEKARKENKPYIPPDSGAVEPIPFVPAAGTVPNLTPAAYAAEQQANYNQLAPQQEDPATGAANDRKRQGLKAQMDALVNARAPEQKVARVQFDAPKPAAGGTSANGSGSPAGGSGQDAAVVVDSLEIFAGSTASPVDTYKTAYASARITSGALAGAFLTGRSTLVNEGLQTNYTLMRWNGRTFKVDAIALDEKTATDAVEANLDRRYLQRYVMPVLFAAAGGYAAAKAQTGSTVVVGIGGSTVATDPPSEKQATNAGIAAGMGIAQSAIEREAQRPIQATLPAGQPIGIMFRAPVLESDASAPAVSAAAGAQQSLQGVPATGQAAAPAQSSTARVTYSLPGQQGTPQSGVLMSDQGAVQGGYGRQPAVTVDVRP
jgi:intracellular multiplication protein IcmE